MTLPSNSSMKCYKENTAAKYTTKLPDNIDLSGSWEVALSEIMYPNKMSKPPYLVLGEECFIRVFMEGNWMTTYYLPEDEYIDHVSLFKDFILMKENYFIITHDEKTNAIEMNCKHPFGSYIFSDTLARVLGFDRTSFELGNIYYGKLFTGDDPSMMFVYCDLIEHVTVGDVRAPLLRSFAMEKSSNELVHRNFTNLIYVPVQKKQFDTIEINIMSDTGDPMPFAIGKSLVLLHFRRSNPYFLQQK